MPTNAVVVNAATGVVAYPGDGEILQRFTAATRAATAPKRIGQAGFEWDTGLYYYATSTAAGAWVASSGGSSFTSGAAVPTGGNDNDAYLRTTNKALYQNIAGVWTILGYLAANVTNTAAQFACPDTVTRDATLAT